MLEVIEINHINYISFNRLLLPAHFKPLQSADPTLWGIGAVYENVQVGILLAKLDIQAKTANIVHFLVRNPEGNLFIIEQLLSAAERKLSKVGYTCTNATVTMIDEEIETVCDLFIKKGWGTNPQIVNKYVMDMKKMQHNDWVWKLEIPAHLKIVNWSPAVEKEFKQCILNQEIDPSIIHYLADYNRIDPDYSFALYEFEELVGWCICESIAQNMVLSIHSYVRKTAATKLGGMLLYAELAKSALENDKYITFFTHVSNKYMQNIISRRFKESTIQKTTLIQFIK